MYSVAESTTRLAVGIFSYVSIFGHNFTDAAVTPDSRLHGSVSDCRVTEVEVATPEPRMTGRRTRDRRTHVDILDSLINFHAALASSLNFQEALVANFDTVLALDT